MLVLKAQGRKKDMKPDKGNVCERKSLISWTILCLVFAVALLLYYDPLLLLWWPQEPAEAGVVPLDMATGSIDDMFDGCRSEAVTVIDLFGVFEWHFNRNFSIAWALAEKKAQKPAHQHVKSEHALVLHIYTELQQEFTKALQTGKPHYSTHNFRFHYMYFFLIDAVKVLRRNQTSCGTVYYRTRTQFHHRNVVNTNMRFGAFTLAASNRSSFDFNGNVSCFEIYTCLGADVTYYSAETQRGQVLIPPYEVFKIKDVLTDEPWCGVVYKLHSTKTPRSDLNCKLDPRQIKEFAGDASPPRYPVNVWMMPLWVVLLIVISSNLVKHRQKRFVAVVLFALLLLLLFVLVSMIMKH